MSQRGYLRQLSTFEEALAASNVHPTVKKQAWAALRKLARGFRPAAGERHRRLRTTFQHLTLAARRADDAIVGRDAGKLLRSIRTMNDFAELEAAAREFRGVVNRKVHKAEERTVRGREPVKDLGDGVLARRVDTGDHLRSLAGRLELCAGHPRWGYRAKLREGDLEFWAFLRDEVPLALLSVRSDTREVDECDGPDHSPVGWSRPFALKVLRELRVHGDECEAFGAVGAYAAFKDKRKVEMQAEAILGGERWRGWLLDGALIVMCKRRGEAAIWGQFGRRSGPLEPTGYGDVTIEQLLDVSAASDEFRALVNASRAAVERPPRRRRRRRARRAGPQARR